MAIEICQAGALSRSTAYVNRRVCSFRWSAWPAIPRDNGRQHQCRHGLTRLAEEGAAFAKP